MKDQKKIKGIHFLFYFFVIISILDFFSCTQKSPLPEFYGFYLVENGKLIEFKKFQEVGLTLHSGRKGIEISYSEMDVKDPNVYFISYEKDVGKKTDSLQIHKLVIVKRFLKWELSSSYKIPPKIYTVNKWLVMNEVFRLKRKPVKNRKDMIYLIPENPLNPGVYAVIYGKSLYDFSVNIDKYDEESEALDRITEPGWAGWMKDKYVPYGQYAKLPIKIVDVKTMWIKSPLKASSSSKTEIVPVIQFKIKNVTKNIIERTSFHVMFKFKDGSRKLCNFSSAGGGFILLPGEKTKNLFTITSYKGVVGRTIESYINNPDWKKVEVELFWWGDKGFKIPVGKFEIDHRIEDLGESLNKQKRITINYTKKRKIMIDRYYKAIKEVKSIATAIEAYKADMNYVPKVDSIKELNADWFVPFYIKKLPLNDPWGNPYRYKRGTGDKPKMYWIGCSGSDGKFNGFNQKGEYHLSLVFEGKDIIFSDGTFTYNPKINWDL